MKDFSKATLRPWNRAEFNPRLILAPHTEEGKNFIVCDVSLFCKQGKDADKHKETNDSNAELIVTAVNNFDQMKGLIDSLNEPEVLANLPYHIRLRLKKLLESIK